MKTTILVAAAVLAIALSGLAGWQLFLPNEVLVTLGENQNEPPAKPAKTKEEMIEEALAKSSNVKGLYMTADVASDPGVGAARIRNKLIRLATTTEINGFVIDVKEACGPDYDESRIRELIRTLHENNIWAIARIVTFSDSSRINVNPDWYLTRKNKKAVGVSCANKRHLVLKSSDGSKPSVVFWQDKAGRYWMDPTHPEVRKYLAEFSKTMIDLGFDELQYDYIRFPSDGDIENANYPSWNGKSSKCGAMRDFFRYLSRDLKAYKPDIILSADLFGYASVGLDAGIGQCLDALEDNFDYISFMTYPSHYYSGFHVPSLRGLPAISYRNLAEARAHPDTIVERSLIFARDFFDGKIDLRGNPATTTQATSTPPATSTAEVLQEPELPKPRSKARLRPWIEDFFHEQDCLAKRPCNEKKVRMQIEATEQTENHGWLLWNAANVYTEGALKKMNKNPSVDGFFLYVVALRGVLGYCDFRHDFRFGTRL